jgi:NarL family two-component system response regulator LiaR
VRNKPPTGKKAGDFMIGKTTSRPIRVMLVDTHVMVRRGLATFLKVFDELQLVGEAESGEAALQLCAEVLPDVILMDMVMPDMGGVTLTRSIHQQFPQVRIIALTSFKEGKLIKSALEAGVIGYLLKDVSADQLSQAILAAACGCATISVDAAQALVETANQSPIPGLDLTEREREILDWIIEGLNTAQIAGKLIVSPSTIKSHASNILSKLRVATRTETVNLVLRNHLVHCPLNLHRVVETKIFQLQDAANERFVYDELNSMRVSE